MTTENGGAELPKKKTKRLSRRPLKRIVRFEIQLGPYSWQFRDGKERPAQSYVIWTAEIPKGKKHPRWLAVFQQMNRPGQYWDRVHNPVLFEQAIVLSGGQDGEYKAKFALHNAYRAAYLFLQKKLLQISRTIIRWRWTTHYQLPETFELIDPPGESHFKEWHAEAMHELGHFLGTWDKTEAFGYLGLSDPTGKVLTDPQQPTTNQ